MKKQTNNINFFKKIYFSICKIKEYGVLAKEGVKKSSYYIMDLIVICSLIYASILTFQMRNNASKLQEYLEQNFPNLTYENNTLKSEAEERVILNDKLVEVNFGGQIIIDTTFDSQSLTKQYQSVEKPTILFSKDKYITINSQGIIEEYDYSEVLGQDLEEGKVIGEEYFANVISNISYSYYFFGYFLGSCIGTSILVFLYNILISVVIFIFGKIRKEKIQFKEIYSMGLYAHTISVLGYFIMVFLPETIAVYIQLLALLIPVGYLVYAVHMNKWGMPEKFE